MSGSVSVNLSKIEGYCMTTLDRAASLAEAAEWTNLVTDGALTLTRQTNPGRAPDQAGLTYRVDREDSGALTLAQIGVDFADSAESQFFYSVTNGVATATSVTEMYADILSPLSEAGTVTYWMGSGLIEAGIEQAIAPLPEAMARATPAVTTFLTSAGQGNPSAYNGSPYTATSSSSSSSSFRLTPGLAVFGAFSAKRNRPSASAVHMENAVMWRAISAAMRTAA